MQYLPMGPAHGRKPMTVVQELRKTGIDAGLVVALVLDNLVSNEVGCLAHQTDGQIRRCVVERAHLFATSICMFC